MSRGLKKHITVGSKRTEILSLLKHKNYQQKVIVMLEGSTDIKLFDKLLDSSQVKLDSFDGKDNVMTIIKGVKDEYPDRVVGICDADFDHLNAVAPVPPIFFTDTHDSETLIIEGVGIDAIISEYATQGYRDGLTRNLLQESLRLAYEIGLLKWFNAQHKHGLAFDEIDFDSFIKITGLKGEFCQEKFIDEVIHCSKSAQPKMYKAFVEGVENLRKRNACQFMVCSGHDVTKILALIIECNHGCTIEPFRQSKVEETLRVSYNKANFALTALYQQLNKWQSHGERNRIVG
ncbi:MAG: hypothetical protein ACI8WB_004057 [Phenylobacterium sp.]|jgi:hypothetical protein